MSKNLSTQFCIHGSSFLSKLLDEIPPVTHFFQHVSVSSCTARKEKIGSLALLYLGRAAADILAEAKRGERRYRRHVLGKLCMQRIG